MYFFIIFNNVVMIYNFIIVLGQLDICLKCGYEVNMLVEDYVVV